MFWRISNDPREDLWSIGILKKIVYENVDLKDFRKSANENRKIFEN